MAGSDEQEATKADVETILSEFGAKEDLLAAFCNRTKGLIEASLQDAGIRYQSVQFRVKTKKKLKEKYLDSTKNYKRLSDITDLAGLRIITYYEDEIDRVAEIINREFDVDLKNSVDKRQVEPDRFGYSAVNYVCSHAGKRASDVEYKKFAGVRCEIQITSILRHAWAEIEHEWYDLKEAYPESVKRRFYRIAALLELAESEFLDIRKQRTNYQRSVAVRVEAKVPNLPIDPVSLKPFIETDPLVNELDKLVASALGREEPANVPVPDSVAERRSIAANGVGIHTLQELRDALVKHRKVVPEFAHRCQEIWPPMSAGRLPRGICIHHLALLISSSLGRVELVALLDKLGVKITPWNLDRQVEIAKEVLAANLE
jgi:putative GTP pyrophosphokinase